MHDTTILLAACVLMSIIGIFSGYIIRSQQRTIDRLNDRLMARDYREYVSASKPREAQEKPRRKPISWHDDPDIEIEDERMN